MALMYSFIHSFILLLLTETAHNSPANLPSAECGCTGQTVNASPVLNQVFPNCAPHRICRLEIFEEVNRSAEYVLYCTMSQGDSSTSL